MSENMVCYKEVLSLKKKKHEGEREGREMEKGYAYNSDGGGTQGMTAGPQGRWSPSVKANVKKTSH